MYELNKYGLKIKIKTCFAVGSNCVFHRVQCIKWSMNFCNLQHKFILKCLPKSWCMYTISIPHYTYEHELTVVIIDLVTAVTRPKPSPCACVGPWVSI